jgi:hypothetical protein
MKKKSFLNNVFIVFLTTVFIASCSSCSHKIAFLNSTVVPAARGYITVNTDKNKNYVIKVELNYLSEANRLVPPKNTYVVWMVSDNNATQNIGQIKTTNGLKASFESVSSTKPTKVFLTAEDDATTQYPTTQVILTTDNF